MSKYNTDLAWRVQAKIKERAVTTPGDFIALFCIATVIKAMEIQERFKFKLNSIFVVWLRNCLSCDFFPLF